MVQVYISYHRAQGKLARALAHRLSTEGMSVWWDRGESPGDKWSEAAAAALSRSNCIIVLWSKAALRSPWILGEATAGFGRHALVNVVTDKLLPPAAFHEAPAVEMIERGEEFDELGWIRLRDLVRLRSAPKPPPAEAVEVLDTGQTTQRSPRPVRRIDWAPAPVQPPKSSSRAPVILAAFVLAGLAGGAWWARDGAPLPLVTGGEDLQPAETFAPPPPPPASMDSAPNDASAMPTDETMLEPDPPGLERVEAVPVAPPPETAALERDAEPPAGKAASPVKAEPRRAKRYLQQPYPTYGATLGQPAPKSPAQAPAAPSTPPPTKAVVPASTERGYVLRAGTAIELDPAGAERARNDLWLSSSKLRSDLFLIAGNGARVAVLERGATRAACEARRSAKMLIPLKILRAENVLCVRTSAGRVSLARIEAIEGRSDERSLRLRVEVF